MKKILLVFGTRPEAIKLAPVYLELKKRPLDFEVFVCVTGQHREMLNKVLEIFEIVPDINLNIMKASQTLSDITSSVLNELTRYVRGLRPDMIMVHGDTTTTLSASMVGFYEKIPVAHVEAGLRTGNLDAPWPEEFNRRVAGMVSSLHLSPTSEARDNLLREGVSIDSVSVTGNTVIDALMAAVNLINSNATLKEKLSTNLPYFFVGRKSILLTGHRRENFGNGFEGIFLSIKKLLDRNKNLTVIYPAHLNPNVLEPAKIAFKDEIASNRLFLIEPQDYLSFVFLMQNVDLIITDSGGVQEEAPTLNIPVLVTRTVTERPEAVAAGCVELVGSDVNLIVNRSEHLLFHRNPTEKFVNPYGDGKASEKIANRVSEFFMDK